MRSRWDSSHFSSENHLRGRHRFLNYDGWLSSSQTRLDHIEAERLAWVLASGSRNYRLIDLRDSSDYAAGHIPGAGNTSLDSLVVAEFPLADTLILYSEGGMHVSQGIYLLWTRGRTAVLRLQGGLESWRDAIPFDTEQSRGTGMKIVPKEAPAKERKKSGDEG